MMIVLSLVLIAAGAAGGYYFFSKKQSGDDQTKNQTQQSVWNPYSTDEHHHIALPEYLISAVSGGYVVKMSVVLDLKNQEAVYQYEGLVEMPKEEVESEIKEGAPATPMQTIIDAKIGTYMLTIKEEDLLDKEKLEDGLKTYLNAQLDMGDDFIKQIYIKNLIIQ